MCQTTPHRRSIFCILPPHLLREIAQNGSSQQRADALQTMTTDQTFRAMRAVQTLPTGPARRPSVLAVEGEKQRTIYDAGNTQNLPGTVVRTEGAPPSEDVAVNEAYDGLGATFDLYWEAYEPFTFLSQVAAVTDRLQIGTGICLVPEHHPISLAKRVASLDSLSNGRFLFGIGAG